jgi:hypothetical protein
MPEKRNSKEKKKKKEGINKLAKEKKNILGLRK